MALARRSNQREENRDSVRINNSIRISPIRVVSEKGEQLGIIPTEDALERARDAGLDLVEVAPNERPPVCRIMDYGKYKYDKNKKKNSGHSHTKTKEIREKNPERIITQAVKGMLPANRQTRQTLKRLKVYAGGEHPHAAQQVKDLALNF